ncbi:MAG: nicotinate-nucleotide--dimethylbenzimidazole phosphoribosyltransferase [Xanthobacteraceae bacterium]|nr:MAG: nicotinate-nucleotide--dimethylbenzimidazole phosphoribosyltransferase [Xanthobacteraceae bacterium]
MAANGLSALAVRPVDRSLESVLRAKVDGKAKPPGSLGRLEDLAIRVGLMRNCVTPRVERIDLFVFAGDHGLTEEGVSSYPAGVTIAMVNTFLAGGACVNALSAAANIDIHVVDAGVAADLPPHPDLIDAKIRHGSRNAAREPALTHDEVRAALTRGGSLVGKAIDKGADAIAIGEMGIGNTASSSLIMHRLIPAPLAECIGVGAGQDDVGLARKRAAIERAAHRSAATDPFEVLSEFGGCEIAMMAGAVLGAAARQRPVLVDGFIASAAALAAVRLQPAALDYCIFAHRSAERGHARLLQALGAEPLLDLGMRLGEGSGAALAGPLLRAAARLLTDVADLADILAAAEA